jgi:tetratricopeptide (TPR) repeat protein
VASLFLAALAVMTKETGIVFPALICSYEWIFRPSELGRREGLVRAVRGALPYAMISIGFLILRALALKRLTPLHTNLDLASVVLAWPKVLMFYGAHLLFPLRLSAFYELINVRQPGWLNFVLPSALICAAAALVWHGSRRSRVFAFLTAWCVVIMIPMLNVTLLYNVENVHDRYLYLPSAALCILLASLLARLKDIGATRTVAVLLTLIAAGYSFVTVRESQYWMNDEVLGQHGIALSPGHPLAAQVLGNAYIRQGRIREAVPQLLDALEAQPDNVDTLASLGLCYSEMNALPLSGEYLTKATALNPSYARTHLLLGSVRFKEGRLAEAEAEFRKAVDLQQISTGTPRVHYYLGNVLYAKGDVRGAVREYQLETLNDPEIDPAVADARARVDEIERQLGLQEKR